MKTKYFAVKGCEILCEISCAQPVTQARLFREAIGNYGATGFIKIDGKASAKLMGVE